MNDTVGGRDGATATVVPAGAHCNTHPTVTARYVCDRCGTYVCSQCVRFGEEAQVWCVACEARAPGTIPWEQRKTLGWPRAIWRTWKETVLSPLTFFGREPREKAVWPTLLYGFLFTFVVQGLDLLVALLQRPDLITTGPGASGAVPAFEAWLASRGVQVATMALMPVLYVAQIYVTAGLWWMALKLVRGIREPFHRVVRVQAYANGVAIFQVARLLGGAVAVFMSLLVALWMVALQVVGHWRAQRTDLWRVLLAFGLLAALAMMMACIGFWLVMSAAAMPGVIGAVGAAWLP